jgi:predicted nucleotidyltransferase
MNKTGDERIKLVTKVVVGSRLHGLDTPTSDWDYRVIHMHELSQVLSPYTKIKNTTWIEGDEDNTSYELIDFCKNATHGNATYLEVFFSDQVIETSPIAEKMRQNWKKFMDTEKFVAASRGYAHNQWNKFYNFEDIGIKQQERTAKFAVAFLRVMWQCEQFLLTGEFKCDVSTSEYYDLMKTIKPLSVSEIQEHLPQIVKAMQTANDRLTEATIVYKSKDHPSNANWMKPDIEWIDNFIYESYLEASLSSDIAKAKEKVGKELLSE